MVAHGLQLVDGAVGTIGVETREVVRPRILIESSGGAHVPDRGQHGALDRDFGFLRSPPRGGRRYFAPR